MSLFNNQFINQFILATRHIALTLITGFLLVSCGGGGGSQTPSTTATGIIGSSGGSITSSNGAIITIDPSVVQDGTPITVTISTPPPSTSSEIAPASSQISVEIPTNALSATNTALDSGISIDIPLTDSTAGGMSAQAALSVAPIFGGRSYRYIKTQIGTTIVYGKYVTKVVSNKVVATTKITYRYAKQQVTQGNPYVINFLVNTFSPNVPTAGTLFEITGIGLNDYVDSLNQKTVVPTGKLPLVLVHGIQALTPTINPTRLLGCDGNAEAYKTTWEEFRKFFFSNLGQPLRDKYQLYTFSYQTDLSIKENGRLLANTLKASFGTLPTVVLAHSMGGLVTRSAMIHHETIGANIGGIITLGTPHHGTKTFNTIAALADHMCFFATDSQGAKDLSWDHFDDLAYDPNTMPSVNPFLVGADGINTLESAYAQNRPEYYQRLLPYAGTIISPAQAIDWPLCPNEIVNVKNLLPPSISPQDVCTTAVIRDYLATWDAVVPERSARYKDYVNGAYLDKTSWSSLPRTYTGISHVTIHDSPWVFLENPDTTAGGISADLLNLYGTALPALTVADTIPPTINAFSISPGSVTQGQSFTISYTVADSGGSGLKQTGLWRANINGASNDSSWAQIGSAVPLSGNSYSGTFTDTPPPGFYWYGIHVIDNANPTVVVHEAFPLNVVVIPTVVPIVQSLAATLVTSTTAQMNGSINPNGLSTSAYFEYGTTTGYGGTTGSVTVSGTSAIGIQSGWSGLTPNTTYHYRAVATNSGGAGWGSDVTFTTPATPLVVNGMVSSYTGAGQKSISLSGSGFNSLSQISWSCTMPNGTTPCTGSPYIWTPGTARWSNVTITSDTVATVYPTFLVATDPSGTYNWSVTFSGGGQSVINYFTVTK